ncbi:uncharacterized protein MONOS_13038 [Monocercomonoides exilis]|uniref:uncharacterized protein n=1 Tax=Monocercomonoides exilis TaxID=2049356 RepID=UPI00355AA719|nr:hypothetical protein MONOS_13038 [Monocercomonoides exilis]|eukprot:MONOS_13038.1-p1 / transcript=MONOS_13038.1 / gene=MONOS_13038 / organism=Monocercomonoides_exilis_PA203 / gene_product=unspecified product / transcript_product=unspecified product / location=Mono_scaffold00770:6703-6963(-) / protein_length=87 / sequence_SO=supercontig / SO=protein_coding / is_pseudo=false
MLQSLQFSKFPGLTPSTEAVERPGGEQSQMNVQSQHQILTPQFMNHSAVSSTQPSDRDRAEMEPSEQAKSTEEPSWICWRIRRGPE